MNNEEEKKKMKLNLHGFPDEDDTVEVPDPPKLMRQRMEDEVRKLANKFFGIDDEDSDKLFSVTFTDKGVKLTRMDKKTLDDEDVEETESKTSESVKTNELINELLDEVTEDMTFDSLEDEIKEIFIKEAGELGEDPEELFDSIKKQAASFLKENDLLEGLIDMVDDSDDDEDDSKSYSDIASAVNDLLSKKGGLLGSLLNSLSIFDISPDGDEDDDEVDDDEESLKISVDSNEIYTLYRLRYLTLSSFGEVEAVEDPDIYRHFQEKFGTDSTKYFDDAFGLQNLYITMAAQSLPLSEIKDSKYILFTPNYILFYAEPKDPDYFGFYYAVVEDRDSLR